MPHEPCEQIAGRFYAAAMKADGSSRSASKEVETSPKQKPHFVSDQRCETRSKNVTSRERSANFAQVISRSEGFIDADAAIVTPLFRFLAHWFENL